MLEKLKKNSKKNEKIVKTLKKGDFLPGETRKNHLSEKPFPFFLVKSKYEVLTLLLQNWSILHLRLGTSEGVTGKLKFFFEDSTFRASADFNRLI